MVPLATVLSNLGLRRLKHRSTVHQPTNALLDVLGDEPRRQASLRRTCLLVGVISVSLQDFPVRMSGNP